MRTREAAIYYDYLAEIMEELSDKIDDIKSEIYDSAERDTYLSNELSAYRLLYSQLNDLCYEG